MHASGGMMCPSAFAPTHLQVLCGQLHQSSRGIKTCGMVVIISNFAIRYCNWGGLPSVAKQEAYDMADWAGTPKSRSHLATAASS